LLGMAVAAILGALLGLAPVLASVERGATDGAAAAPKAGCMIPLGPIQQVDRLARHHILTEDQQPLLLRPPKVAAVLKRFGLDSLSSLSEQHGGEALFVYEGDMEQDFLASRRVKVSTYLKKMQKEHPKVGKLPESGGRDFFLRHPDIYKDVARAYARLLPKGYQDMLDVSSSAARAVLTEAAEAHDFGVSDLALWLGGVGHVNALHVDYVAGQLLTHLEGRKRIILFPAAQHDLLYLGKNKGAKGWSNDDEGWGASSRVPASFFEGRATDLQQGQFADFAKATPMVVDLKPGETLFIPCGWAHVEQYDSPSISISSTIHPDWLEPLLKEDPSWSPEGCRVWIREPCDEDGCGFAEL